MCYRHGGRVPGRADGRGHEHERGRAGAAAAAARAARAAPAPPAACNGE